MNSAIVTGEIGWQEGIGTFEANHLKLVTEVTGIEEVQRVY